MLQQIVFQGNSLERVLMALLVTLGAGLALWLLKTWGLRLLRRLARRTAAQWDDALIDVLSATSTLLVAAALYAGMQTLELSPRLTRALDQLLAGVLWLQVGLWGNRAIRHLLKRRFAMPTGGVAATASVLTFLARLVLWSLVTLLVLDNLGFNISTLIASLGVGGVAVALATQNILGDLFASLSIALDQPFLIGDSITVDSFTGTVEYVGMKTTRLRSQSGEQLIFSNADLLKSRIRNNRRMTERRMVFTFGVTYATPADKLEALPAAIREIVEKQSPVRFERAWFKAFGASALEFEVAYFVLTAEGDAHLDIQQAINLALVRHMGKEGVAFAFPSQTVYFGQALQVEQGAPGAAR